MFENIPPELFKKHGQLDLMLRLIRIGHGQQLYNGFPYWHHPVRVLLRMNWIDMVSDDVYVGLGHDLFEDTFITENDLLYFGFSGYVVGGITRLSRLDREEQTYKEYVAGLIEYGNLKLLHTKLSDLYENSNNVRFLPPEKRKILVRYGKSIKEIQDFLSTSEEGRRILKYTISGELNKETVEAWIGQEPTFL